MIKRPLPPYGRQILIPAFPYLMVFVNEPECWEHASEQRRQGFNNNLCLPDINKAGDYAWPVRGLAVVVILFGQVTAAQVRHLVNVIASYEPKEIAVRHFDETSVISFTEEAS